MLSARSGHSSCVIQSDDGSVDSIIIIGGWTDKTSRLFRQGRSNTTEIFNIKEQKWVPGPTFPCEISDSACVSLPSTMKFTCLVIGGEIEGISCCCASEPKSNDVWGLNKSLTKWTHLGRIRKSRSRHIVLPLL